MSAVTAPPALAAMTKAPSRPGSSGGSSSTSSTSMRASAGGWRRAFKKSSSVAGAPCASISTPAPSLRTKPLNPRCVASR